jgi:hypothetical protein
LRSKAALRLTHWSLVAAVLAMGLAPLPAEAAGGGHGSKKKAAKEESVPAVPSVNMPMLVAPVMIKGKLARYVYLNVTLVLPDESNKMMLLDKVPYIQDAFLREVHRGTIALGEDPDMLDEAGLGRRLLDACIKVVGPDIVKKVDFRDLATDFR